MASVDVTARELRWDALRARMRARAAEVHWLDPALARDLRDAARDVGTERALPDDDDLLYLQPCRTEPRISGSYGGVEWTLA